MQEKCVWLIWGAPLSHPGPLPEYLILCLSYYLSDQQRENDRQLRRAGREIERERAKLEMEEKKVEAEIKKLAAAGNKEGCALLAKQLIQLRKQKTRSYAANSKVSSRRSSLGNSLKLIFVQFQITSIGIQNKAMTSNIALTDAMATTSKTMGDMNKIMNPAAMGKTMRDFQAANMKMEMTDEMINDTMDDILADSDDEMESNKIVDQILDEIGIDVSNKVSEAPSAVSGTVGADTVRSDKDIAAQLAKLRSS